MTQPSKRSGGRKPLPVEVKTTRYTFYLTNQEAMELLHLVAIPDRTREILVRTLAKAEETKR